MTARRMVRLARSISVAVLLVTAPMMHNGNHSDTVTVSNRCATIPKVKLKRDCFITQHRVTARAFYRSDTARCIRSRERSGSRSVNPAGPYFGWAQMSRTAFESVGPNRFDHVHPFRNDTLYTLKVRRLHRIRGSAPWGGGC